MASGSRFVAAFTVPDGIVYRVICEESGALSTAKCTHVRREVFIEGTEPRTYCDKDETSISSFDDLDQLEGDHWNHE